MRAARAPFAIKDQLGSVFQEQLGNDLLGVSASAHTLGSAPSLIFWKGALRRHADILLLRVNLRC